MQAPTAPTFKVTLRVERHTTSLHAIERIVTMSRKQFMDTFRDRAAAAAYLATIELPQQYQEAIASGQWHLYATMGRKPEYRYL